MPLMSDFRTSAFDISKVEACGKFMGRNIYWKLYAIENLLRVIVHSVLAVQISPSWWATAVSPSIATKVARVKAQYASQPWHTQPGGHDIYCLFLPDLNEVIRANSNLFVPIIPDIDQWIAKFEQIRIPRNVVGHMNWPSAIDQKRVDIVFSDIIALSTQLTAKGLQLAVPS